MREYGVDRCFCKKRPCVAITDEVYRRRIDGGYTEEVRYWQGRGEANYYEALASKHTIGFCIYCDAKLGINERGPWREAMVPRAALEWLAGISEGCAQVSPCPAAVLSYDKRDAACRECLMQAALKAAEEASDD
jgi:hypothetical protein